jgi:hypothetical protein
MRRSGTTGERGARRVVKTNDAKRPYKKSRILGESSSVEGLEKPRSFAGKVAFHIVPRKGHEHVGHRVPFRFGEIRE